MTAFSTFNVKENDPEQGSSTSIRHASLSAANIDATLAAVTALQNAIDAVILGGLSKKTVQAVEEALAYAAPPTGAQRELRWFVGGIDGNGNPQRMTIPTADTSLVVSGGSAMADGLPKSDLITAIEALWVSNADSPVTVTEVTLVGRT